MNQVHLSEIINDDIGQHANAINQKHNVDLSTWGLDGKK